MLVVVSVCHDKIPASMLSLLAGPLASLISVYMRTVGGHNIHRLPARLAETDDLRLSHHILSGNRHSGLCVILGVDPHQLLLSTCHLRDLMLLLRIRQMLSAMQMSSNLCRCFGIQELLLKKRYQLVHGSS